MSASSTSTNEYPLLVTGTKSAGWWGIFMLVLIESAVFAGLIGSYFYLFANATVWPPDGTSAPELTLPLIYTPVLLFSGLAAWIGDRALTRGDVSKMRLWRGVGVITLAAFIAMKVYEYATLDYLWDESAYTSILWLIAGFHTAHVITVFLKEIVIQVLAWKGFFTQRRRGAIEAATLYWVFVVLMWLPLFATVYFFPRYA